MEEEFAANDRENRWPQLFAEIRNESQDFPYRVAKAPENRNLNRYRDVSPFDHSRVKLLNPENDYINASLIVEEEAQRSYILTQGPLPNTCGHFWLMVWEQKSKAVVMLNRVVEKGSVKCEQYWPSMETGEMPFEDVGFQLRILSEDVQSHYTVRKLQLKEIYTNETREIFHFHYTTWPDFGVPDSPASFLSFLFLVRESDSLNSEHGPAVVHCSAGIGRSGTFSLVDTCLLLMEKRKDPSSVDIKKVLLGMRKDRMGLIQTADQLRFSYVAVIEGAKYIKGDSSGKKRWKPLSDQNPNPVNVCSPPPPQPPPSTVVRYNGNKADCLSTGVANVSETKSPTEPASSGQQENEDHKLHNLRKRLREDRRANTAQQVQRMKQKQSETEMKRKRWLFWKPYIISFGAVATLAAGAFICWRIYFQ